MTPRMRWVRFNVVGVAGFVLQIVTLSLLVRCAGLTTSVAVAVLVAVSHNFVWHEHFTWPNQAQRDQGSGIRDQGSGIGGSGIGVSQFCIFDPVLGRINQSTVAWTIATCGTVESEVGDDESHTDPMRLGGR